MAKLEFDMQVM